LSDDWFGKLSVTPEPILVDSYPWLMGDLLLRLGTIMPKVGWNVLGPQPFGDWFLSKISALCHVFLCLYIIISFCIDYYL
jgi:hypothetical protein